VRKTGDVLVIVNVLLCMHILGEFGNINQTPSNVLSKDVTKINGQNGKLFIASISLR